jgi:hypothetical protein
MRAKEFTINVPINIKINGDGNSGIDVWFVFTIKELS